MKGPASECGIRLTEYSLPFQSTLYHSPIHSRSLTSTLTQQAPLVIRIRKEDIEGTPENLEMKKNAALFEKAFEKLKKGFRAELHKCHLVCLLANLALQSK